MECSRGFALSLLVGGLGSWFGMGRFRADVLKFDIRAQMGCSGVARLMG